MTTPCRFCGCTEHLQREVLLNTRGASLIGFDFLNEGAIVAQCKECGHLEWFAKPRRS